MCGAVRYDASVPRREILACHCGQCQRWTGGGPFFSVDVEDARFTGEADISAHHASEWGERAFCSKCGSTLYWRMRGGPVTGVAAGTLDDQEGFAVTREIFCDRRAGWLDPWSGASQSTEAEEFAKLEDALGRA